MDGVAELAAELSTVDVPEDDTEIVPEVIPDAVAEATPIVEMSAAAFNILALLERATEADLQAIDAKIIAKREEMAKFSQQIHRDIDSLQQLRTLIDYKLHGQPIRRAHENRKPRGPRKTSPAATAASTSPSMGSFVPTATPHKPATYSQQQRQTGTSGAVRSVPELYDAIVDEIKACGPLTSTTLCLKLKEDMGRVRHVLGHNSDVFVQHPVDKTWSLKD